MFSLRVATAFLSILMLGGTMACGPRPGGEDSDEATVEAPEIFLTPVLFITAKRADLNATISATGSLVPVSSLAVRTEEPGRLHFAKPWREGEQVEEGALLARIESHSLAGEMRVAEADIEIQKESLDLGERTLTARLDDYRTLTDLYAQGITAEKDVDAARLELDRARNGQRQSKINLLKAESRILEVKERLRSLEVYAARGGLLVSRATLEGQGQFSVGFGRESITDYDGLRVSAGHLVCGIADVSSVYMRCDVTARDAGAVERNQKAMVSVYAGDEIVTEGSVAGISNSVNAETRAFEVDLLLENENDELKPGMFGKAEIVTETRRDAMSLPREAITRRNNRDVVFIVEKLTDAEHEVARMVPVELGLEGKDEVEVTFGVKEGDRVVVRGFEVIQDQTPVSPIDVEAPVREQEDGGEQEQD